MFVSRVFTEADARVAVQLLRCESGRTQVTTEHQSYCHHDICLIFCLPQPTSRNTPNDRGYLDHASAGALNNANKYHHSAVTVENPEHLELELREDNIAEQ
jgi:hypothetical protein